MKPELAEVIALQAAYSYTHDHGETAQFGALFAADAVFCRPGNPDIIGREAIEEFARSSGKAGVHTSGAPLVLEDGTARTPFVFVGSGSGRISSGYYHDTFTTSDVSRLVFSRRDVEILSKSGPS